MDSKHPLPGAWVALAQAQVQPFALANYVTDFTTHFADCKECIELFESLRTDDGPDSGQREAILAGECPSDSKGVAELVIALADPDLEKADRLVLMRHLNDCGDCYEHLISNWTEYLGVMDYATKVDKEVTN